MAAGGVTRLARRLLPVAIVAAPLAAGLALWNAFYERNIHAVSVDREDDGRVLTKVIDSEIRKAGDLRVARLTGTVQATSSDSRMWGWLPATYVMKAPFAVSYFIDMRRMDRSKFFWDEKGRTLTVLVPDVMAERASVDQSRITFERTDGIFVGPSAMARLRRRASGKALDAAGIEARNPANIETARRNGREMLATLYGQPLRIAGVEAAVRVRFEGEPVRDGEQWDRSRSLAELYAAGQP